MRVPATANSTPRFSAKLANRNGCFQPLPEGFAVIMVPTLNRLDGRNEVNHLTSETSYMFTSLARALPLVGALIALLPAAASAHGPTRQKVVTKIDINAPVDKVWAVIGNFQDMSWHPLFKKTEGAGGNDAGATRTLTLESGAKIEEKLGKRSDEERAMSYEITKVDVKDVPVTNYSSTISVSGTAEKSIVEWRGAFYRGYVNNDPPPELSDQAAVDAINKVYATGLGALKAHLEKSGG